MILFFFLATTPDPKAPLYTTLNDILNNLANLENEMTSYTGDQGGIADFLNRLTELQGGTNGNLTDLPNVDFSEAQPDVEELLDIYNKLVNDWNEYKQLTTTTREL